MKKKKTLTKKTKGAPKKDIEDVLEGLTLSSSIASLEELSSETLEFSTMKHKELLKDYEKLRFKKKSKK